MLWFLNNWLEYIYQRVSFLSWDQKQCKRPPEYGHTDTWIHAGLIMHGQEPEELFALKVCAHSMGSQWLSQCSCFWSSHPNQISDVKGSCHYCCLVAKSCVTLCHSLDHSPPDSSVHEISQARILEWVTIFFYRGPSWPRDRTCISCFGGWILYHWATREATMRRNICQVSHRVHFKLWKTVTRQLGQ